MNKYLSALLSLSFVIYTLSFCEALCTSRNNIRYEKINFITYMCAVPFKREGTDTANRHAHEDTENRTSV